MANMKPFMLAAVALALFAIVLTFSAPPAEGRELLQTEPEAETTKLAEAQKTEPDAEKTQAEAQKTSGHKGSHHGHPGGHGGHGHHGGHKPLHHDGKLFHHDGKPHHHGGHGKKP